MYVEVEGNLQELVLFYYLSFEDQIQFVSFLEGAFTWTNLPP